MITFSHWICLLFHFQSSSLNFWTSSAISAKKNLTPQWGITVSGLNPVREKFKRWSLIGQAPRACHLAPAVTRLCLFLFPSWSCREMAPTACPVRMVAGSHKARMTYKNGYVWTGIVYMFVQKTFQTSDITSDITSDLPLIKEEDHLAGWRNEKGLLPTSYKPLFTSILCSDWSPVQCSIWQAPPACLLVPAGRHLCLFPFHLWSWIRKHTANPARTTGTARVATYPTYCTWLHLCLNISTTAHIHFCADIAICLCWLNEALHECFFEFWVLQSGLVTSLLSQQNPQDKTEITMSIFLWRKVEQASQSEKNLWKALKSAWGMFSGSGGAASLPLPFPLMKL